MVYYPVLITTLNRYSHFKECVESLSRNTYADQTELVIGLDYPPSDKYLEGYSKIKDYIPQIKGFKKVTVFERTENYGPKKNFNTLKDYAFEHYDAIIGTEDDNVFSPCFLDFMNKGLNHYRDDKRVTTVSGYVEPQYYGLVKNKVMLKYDCSPWGMGMWQHKVFDYSPSYYHGVLSSWAKSWKVFRKSPGLFAQLLGMVELNIVNGDAARSVISIIDDTFQFSPSVSLVRNMGYDDTGVTCGSVDLYDRTHQVISENRVYDVDFEKVSDFSEKGMRKALFLYELPTPYGYYYTLKFILKTIVNYLKFRVTEFHEK